MGIAYYQELSSFEAELIEAFCAGCRWAEGDADKSPTAAANEYVKRLIEEAVARGRPRRPSSDDA